jgi:hypothetical protein
VKRFLFLLVALHFCILADSGYFDVKDIEVKQRESNSLIAKQNALRQATNLAFKKMIQTELDQNFPSINSISNPQIQDCIYEYSIDQEKFSDSVYIGKISYRFSKNKVMALLKSYGLEIKPEDKVKIVRLSVYLKDFLIHEKKLREMKVIIEKFSDNKIIFSINGEHIKRFRRLRIKYARLT